VPIDPALVDRFNPDKVPTVGDLLSALPKDSADKTKKEGGLFRDTGVLGWTEVPADYEYTALEPYVKLFEQHVAAILKDVKGSRNGVWLSPSWAMS
jgi:DNA primase small subunit